jgi:cell division septal protein FtsQ
MAKKGRSNASSVRLKAQKKSRNTSSRNFSRFILPLLICAVLLVATGVIVALEYKTATSSGFFRLSKVEVSGNDRTSADEIKRIVTSSVEKSGVWMADISELRAKIEKFPFVKTAAVSVALPAEIRVSITERQPAAAVQLSFGDYLVDGEGVVLAAVGASEKMFPVIMRGWDESKTEKAVGDNQARLKLYKKMLDEWRKFDLSKRVKELNLANTREPVAVVEDSGRDIAVTLAKDNFGKNLKTALDALNGKGAKIKSVDAGGVFPVIQYLEF